MLDYFSQRPEPSRGSLLWLHGTGGNGTGQPKRPQEKHSTTSTNETNERIGNADGNGVDKPHQLEPNGAYH